MTNEHLPNCDCYDCNHLDRTKIGFYLDGILLALKPTKVWTLPGVKKGGVVKYTVSPGVQIGRIYSWTKDANGATWLQLVDPSTPANKVNTAKIIGYTPFIPDQFDKETVFKTSSGKRIEDVQKKIEEMPTFSTSPLLSFGKKLKWIIIGVIVLMVLTLFTKLKS